MRSKTISIGPYSIFTRVIVHQIATQCGLHIQEDKSLFSSNFRLSGNMNQLRNFKTSLEIIEQDENRAQEMANFRERMFKERWRWWKPNTWSKIAKAIWLWTILIVLIPTIIVGGVHLIGN